MTGRYLRTEIALSTPAPASAGTARWTLPSLPTNPFLPGLNFLQQAVVPSPGTDPAGLVLSKAYRGVIGP